jgi:translation initiation factor IF-1
MPRDEQVELRGRILKTLPNTTWLVEIPGNQQITAYLGGKLRKNNIRIEPGDEVLLELSPYSLSMGRIVYRF